MFGVTFGWSRADLDGLVGRYSGDPLGLRAWANRVSRDLTPGVTNVTSRVQGFALFCAGVRIGRQASSTMVISADEAFRRFEALWVHAQTRRLLAGADVTRWPGSRTAERVATEARVDLSIALLSQPLASGVFGAYRRSAVRFGLAHPPMQGGPIRPGTTTLTATGTALAELCLRKFWLLPTGNTLLLKILRNGQATAEQLWQVRPDVDGRPEESALMNRALKRSDQAAQDGLAALRRFYDSSAGHPDRDDRMCAILHRPAELTPTQNEARSSAEVIRHLVDDIEQPYRQWLVGKDVPAPSARLWNDDKLWAAVEAGGGTEAAALRTAARTTTGWDGVHQWQQQLAALRGADALERFFVPTDYGSAKPPAFGLLAVGSLFFDGLLE